MENPATDAHENHGSDLPCDSSSSSSLSELRSNIENQRSVLMHIMDVNYGLLDELYSSKVLTYEQIEPIRSKSSESDKVSQLLDCIVKVSQTDYEKFVSALRKTGQSHVISHLDAERNYELTDNVVADNEERLRYPLLSCSEFRNMEYNWCQLIELMDTENGLLDELLTCGCLNNQHLQDIESKPTRSVKNYKLLDIMRRKSLADFQTLLKCLKLTKQCHIVSLLDPNSDNPVKPLTEDQQSKIRKNYSTLVRLIDAKSSGLLSVMHANGCITSRQMEYIAHATSNSESNKRLLDILRFGSELDFHIFKDCLTKTRQQHVARLLSGGDGSVAYLVANTAADQTTRRQELDLVKRFIGFLEDCPNDSMNHIMSVLNQYANSRRDAIELVAMTTPGSIGLYFRCKTIHSLNYLQQITASGELKTAVEKIFCLLKDNCAVQTNEIVWNSSDYNSCAHFLYEAAGLPLLAQIYCLSSKESGVNQRVSRFQIEKFPHEIVECFLFKAVGQLAKYFCSYTSQEVLYSLTTMMSVSSYWWNTFTHRIYMKTLLKRTFVLFSQPYRPCSKQAISICLNQAGVYGVAQIQEQLFVLGYGPFHTIQVYSLRQPFSHVKDIVVPGMVGGTDMTSCPGTDKTTGVASNRLFIVDYIAHCIWQITLSDAKDEVKQLVKLPGAPWSLSVRGGRILVTLACGGTLVFHDESRQDLLSISVPNSMWVYHAIETVRGTIVVAHTSKRIDCHQFQGYSGVSELSTDGSVVLHKYVTCELDDPMRSVPYYLVTGDDGSIVYADRSTKRIILLNSDLTMQRMLIEPTAHPKRICLQDGRLSVCFYDSKEINVYLI